MTEVLFEHFRKKCSLRTGTNRWPRTTSPDSAASRKHVPTLVVQTVVECTTLP